MKAKIASVLVTRHRVKENQIAALTPYSAQKEEIKKHLLAKGLSAMQAKTITESQGYNHYTYMPEPALIRTLVCIIHIVPHCIISL